MFLSTIERNLLNDFKLSKNFDLDVLKKDDQVLVKAYLPGFKKEDISVDLSGEVLTIKAENKESKKEDYLYRESFSRVERSVRLKDVDGKSVKAEYKDGVLNLSFNQSENKIKIL